MGRISQAPGQSALGYYVKKREMYKAFKLYKGKACLALLRMPMTLETLPQTAVI